MALSKIVRIAEYHADYACGNFLIIYALTDKQAMEFAKKYEESEDIMGSELTLLYEIKDDYPVRSIYDPYGVYQTLLD